MGIYVVCFIFLFVSSIGRHVVVLVVVRERFLFLLVSFRPFFFFFFLIDVNHEFAATPLNRLLDVGIALQGRKAAPVIAVAQILVVVNVQAFKNPIPQDLQGNGGRYPHRHDIVQIRNLDLDHLLHRA